MVALVGECLEIALVIGNGVIRLRQGLVEELLDHGLRVR